MQGMISPEVEGQFITAFFASLQNEQGRFDIAMNAGRNAIQDDELRWMPALFTGLRDCRIQATPMTGSLPTRRRNELLQIIKQKEIPLRTLQIIYHRSRPTVLIGETAEEWVANANSPERMVDHLLEMSKTPQNRVPILVFALLVAQAMEEESEHKDQGRLLRNWLEEVSPEFSLQITRPYIKDLSQELQQEGQATQEPELAVLILPADKKYQEKSWTDLQTGMVTIRIYEWAGNQQGERVGPVIGCAADNAPAQFVQAFSQYAKLARLIEFVIPATFNLDPADQWEMGDSLSMVKLGSRYRIVVRSLERMQIAHMNRQLHQFWKKKWQSLHEVAVHSLTSSLDWVCSPDQYKFDVLKSHLGAEKKGCVALTFTPIGHTDPLRKSILSVILGAGIPVALWVRSDQMEQNAGTKLRQILEPMLQAKRVADLTDWLLEQRQNLGETDIGDRLTLLMDNPYRLLPQAQLSDSKL